MPSKNAPLRRARVLVDSSKGPGITKEGIDRAKKRIAAYAARSEVLDKMSNTKKRKLGLL